MEFEEAVKYIIESEGGYVNHPNDPGGETKYGISKRAYPNEDIKNLSRQRAADLYLKDYWLPSSANLLPEKLRYIHFDTAVNCGVRTAAKILQRAAGVKDDGLIGAITLAAAAHLSVQHYANERLFYYDKIIEKNKKLEVFKKGWHNRVQHVLNKSK